MKYLIYSDESCHLENDGKKAMVLGAICCSEEKKRGIVKDLRKIKINHNITKNLEIKWSKVSSAKLEFYKDLIKYYFKNNDLFFRALIVPDKSKLEHGNFSQSHDEWYYKMYYQLLNPLLSPKHTYHVFVDIKDTHSNSRTKELKSVLMNANFDFNNKIIQDVQVIRSDESIILQLADLIIGAISYHSQGSLDYAPKIELIELIKELSGYSLTQNTLLKEEKLNLFFWKGRQ